MIKRKFQTKLFSHRTTARKVTGSTPHSMVAGSNLHWRLLKEKKTDLDLVGWDLGFVKINIFISEYWLLLICLQRTVVRTQDDGVNVATITVTLPV